MKIEKLHDLIDVQNEQERLLKENGMLKLKIERIQSLIKYTGEVTDMGHVKQMLLKIEEILG